jgi:hypothetical protein
MLLTSSIGSDGCLCGVRADRSGWPSSGFGWRLGPRWRFVGLTLTGLGYSLVHPGFGVEALHRAPAHSRSLAMGAYTAFLDLSLGLASPALGLVASGARLGRRVPCQHADRDVRRGYRIAAAICAVARLTLRDVRHWCVSRAVGRPLGKRCRHRSRTPARLFGVLTANIGIASTPAVHGVTISPSAPGATRARPWRPLRSAAALQ